MARTVECFFDFGSPASYLAYMQLPKIAAETGATIAWRPMLLGGVFKATGNASPVTVPAKGRWMMADLQRHARRYGVPFAFNPAFPVNTLALMRGATGVQLHAPKRFMAYCDAVFHAMWAEPQPMSDGAVAARVLQAAGFDAASIERWTSDPAVKARLQATTEEAVARGVFGAPSLFVDGELHFGQDRLDWVREALLVGR